MRGIARESRSIGRGVPASSQPPVGQAAPVSIAVVYVLPWSTYNCRMDSQELFRRLMALTGMNATQFAGATGLTESMISRTLNGRNDPSFNKVAAAIERLGFTVAFVPISQADLDASLHSRSGAGTTRRNAVNTTDTTVTPTAVASGTATPGLTSEVPPRG